MNTTPFLKPGKIFDVTTYRGIILHMLFWGIITLFLWFYPSMMGYEGDQKVWWHYFALYIAVSICTISTYALVLLYSMRHNPKFFKKIATKNYLKLINYNPEKDENQQMSKEKTKSSY